MRCRHLIVATLLFVVMASSPAIAVSPIGATVQASTTVSASGRTLRRASPLFLNDVLRSNATGIGQFVFDDGTKLAMGPSASVTIDKSIVKGKSAQRASIQASRGAFRFISGALSGRKIATPYGTIGIRGTAFDFTIRNGRVYILLFRGAVSFCGGGSCKTLRRSCDYLVAGGGGVSDPKPLSSDSGLNIGQAFPLVVNQGRLASQFRQAGKACLSRAVQRTQGVRPASKVQKAASTSEPADPGSPGAPGEPGPGPGPGPGPSPAGKGNKGLGNGGEADDNGSASESNNPGNNNGKGKGKNK